jgi:hypothetical protein
VENHVAAGQLAEQRVQFGGQDQVVKAALGNVLPFAVGAQIVHQDDVAPSGGIEIRDDVRTDEARRSGDDDHGLFLFGFQDEAGGGLEIVNHRP